jgi:hypothetical protein
MKFAPFGLATHLLRVSCLQLNRLLNEFGLYLKLSSRLFQKACLHHMVLLQEFFPLYKRNQDEKIFTYSTLS